MFTVLFATGRASLSPEAASTIQQAAAAARAGQASVTITGHTDTVGSQAMNMALSQRRADAVRGALISNGVPAGSITSVVGTGETNLPQPTGDNVADQRNRSVDIAVARTAPVMSDAEYCRLLANKWRDYSRTQPAGPAPQAIAQCDAGDYANGIPTLQRILTDDRISFPPRT
jgi:hypothetical protein